MTATPQAPGADAGPETGANADLDQDGIPDALEEQLIRRYRPYYRFSVDGSSGEPNRPADPIAEAAHAQLKRFGDPGKGTTGRVAGCGRASDGLMDPPSSLFTCAPDTNAAKVTGPQTYCLDLDDARYPGVSFDQAQKEATGFYGHVVPDTVNGHPAYKIEYWQFFAFNYQAIPLSLGDHEGDWTGVQVWFDQTANKIVKLEYLIHGKTVTFNVPDTFAPTCTSCRVDVKGAHYDPSVGNFFDATERAKYNDNQAEFWLDEQGYRHVVVFLERGAHEFWPGAWGVAEPVSIGPVAIHNDGHNGAGPAYLVPDVTDRTFNLGEVGHPLTDEAKILLGYDGHWGCTNASDAFDLSPVRQSPVGPAMHCEWKWPNKDTPIGGCYH